MINLENMGNVSKNRYLDMVDFLNNSFSDTLKNQWIFVHIKSKSIKRKEDITIKSSIDDKLIEETIFGIFKKTNFSLQPDYFFTLLIKDNMFLVPIKGHIKL